MPSANNGITIPPTQTEKIRLLFEIVQAASDNNIVDGDAYGKLRSNLLEVESLTLPVIVKESRDTRQLQDALTKLYSGPGALNYRRILVYQMFKHLIDKYSLTSSIIVETELYKSLEAFNFETVHVLWQDAMDLRTTKPYIAITIANSLLETVCIFILGRMSKKKIPTGIRKMFTETSKVLRLAPDGQTNEILNSLLSSLTEVVWNLGRFRNDASGAHGTSINSIRPLVRHATLALNTAGTLSTFLLETYLSRNEGK